jgi:predicted DNA-binding transcriptional regulator AlpA
MKQHLSIDETNKRSGISPRTIYDQVSRSAKRPFPIGTIHIGRLVKFDQQDLEKFIENQKNG